MKRIMTIALLAFAVVLCAQEKVQAPVAPPPTLTTADQVALQAVLKAQQDASKQWQDNEQTKLAILREWAAGHPGYHIHYNPQNPQDAKNYSVEADAPVAKPDPKK